MNNTFDHRGFLKTVVYPSLLILVLPAFAWGFFLHATWRFDSQYLAAIEQSIRQDHTLTPEQRAEAIAFYRAHPVSQMLLSSDPEIQDLVRQTPDETRFHYATFRWMQRLAVFCLVSSVVVAGVLIVAVRLSRRSHRAMYASLWTGWNLLRIFATTQVLAQAVLLCVLSFWVTALWFGIYFVQLIGVSGLLALASVIPMLLVIFRRVDITAAVAGRALKPNASPDFWARLEEVNRSIGAKLPAQVIVGLDDNFFVTECPVWVDGVAYRGRTLFVSLPLLKILNGGEADAVLAHELAHFSGDDAYFSKKLTPLLVRYEHYLAALSEGLISRPVFHCMLLFRTLYEMSLGALRRQREFRADRLAADSTSPDEVASSLARIVAYSAYRESVQQELFGAETVHEQANISARLEQGFQDFATRFAAANEAYERTSMHPFDSHPPLKQRFEALGFTADADSLTAILSTPGDGAWFEMIAHAATIEQQLWSSFERDFQQVHECSLAFRYLPSTEEERAVVEKFFPRIELPSARSSVIVLDCEAIHYEDWDAPLRYGEIQSMELLRQWGTPLLRFTIAREGVQILDLPMNSAAANQQSLVNAVQKYAGRHAAAVEYQRHLSACKPDDADSASGA